MISIADEDGRFKSDPGRFKQLVFALGPEKIDEVQSMIEHICNVGLITLYKADNQLNIPAESLFGAHPNWTRWQKFYGLRYHKSTLPDPASGLVWNGSKPAYDLHTTVSKPAYDLHTTVSKPAYDCIQKPNLTQPNLTKENKVSSAKGLVPLADKSASIIVEHFNRECNVSLKETPKKAAQIRSRLITFTIDQLKEVITKRKSIPFYMGENSENKVWFNDWDSLFRNDERIERILNYVQKGKGGESLHYL